MNQPPTRGEELPPEEIDGLPDWNTRAWQAIQARDAERPPAVPLHAYVADLPDQELGALRATLSPEPADAPLRAAVLSELFRRTHSNAARGPADG